MNLKELKARGAFVSAHPVTKNVTWQPPEGGPVDFDIFIKRLSFGTVEQVFLHDDADRSRSANYIAQAVMFADDAGKPVAISYDEAFSLEPTLARVFLDAINDVNKTGQAEKN